MAMGIWSRIFLKEQLRIALMWKGGTGEGAGVKEGSAESRHMGVNEYDG